MHLYKKNSETSQSEALLKAIHDRYEESEVRLFVTFFQHRTRSGDALVEFADPRHAAINEISE